MRLSTVGTDLSFRPLWAPEDEGTQGSQVTGDAAAAVKVGDPNAKVDGAGDGQNGSADFDPAKAFAELEPATREWLQKGNLDKSPAALAKKAHEQEKLLGNAVRVPGKDATPEERDAFLNKLGRPEKADAYQFTAPKDLPEGLPYDGDKAAAFKSMAHELGLTQAQAAKLHDFYIGEQLGAYTGATAAQAQALAQRAETATATLEKEWGPLKGEKFAANLEIANKVFTEVPGGQDVLAELQGIGLVGPNKEILSVPIAKMLSAIGTALYTEDGVLRGKPDVVGNPFDKNGSNFNLTSAMKIVKEDPDRALSLVTAAGGKPSEWGLKT